MYREKNARAAADSQKQYEEMMSAQERKHSETISQMEKDFLKRLNVVNEQNEELREQMKADTNAMGSSPAAEPPPYCETRLSVSEDSVPKNRSAEFQKFIEKLRTDIRLLDNGVLSRDVVCDMFDRKLCFMKLCVNCDRNIGAGSFYSKSRQKCSFEVILTCSRVHTLHQCMGLG